MVQPLSAITSKVLDCTLRDGGYYTAWDFPTTIIERYLDAMRAARVDVVELGFRFLRNEGFKGACAYTTDHFIRSLAIPEGLALAVMLNGADLLGEMGLEAALQQLVPESAETSALKMVRIACHFHEFERVLPACDWLKRRGYAVGFNLMQMAGHTREEVSRLASSASDWPVDVLYFADSTGSMKPADVCETVAWLREGWSGALGFHAHDNMGLALQNTLTARTEGVEWLDATITGMGRGPGNVRIEELLIELAEPRANLVPLLALIGEYFAPLKVRHGWGTNAFYYLPGSMPSTRPMSRKCWATRAMAKRTCLPLSTIYVGKVDRASVATCSSVPVISMMKRRKGFGPHATGWKAGKYCCWGLAQAWSGTARPSSPISGVPGQW